MTTFVLDGEIDIARVESLRPALVRWQRRHCGASVWVLDCAAVSFMDGVGLRLIDEFDAQVRASGGRVFLASPSPAVRRLLWAVGSGLPVLEGGLDPTSTKRPA